MSTYYEETLYPLQDRILAVIDSVGTPFYLTGGTALSRFFYQYRYSDDLDFFVNSYDDFSQAVDTIILRLHAFATNITVRTDTYCALQAESILKIDFVNDTGSFPRAFHTTPLFSKVDLPERILANKLSALVGREDPKDIIDLWIIATHQSIDWRTVFTDISSRAVGIFPPFIAEKIHTFPIELLDRIKWVEGKKPEAKKIQDDLEHIARAIIEAE